MKDQPLVTVITASYNIIKNKRQKTFLQAVNSVRKQCYKNIEHIIIDNASDDGSIQLYEKENLKYFSSPDNGIFDAFNKGVKSAKGEYILFLNSDDFYHNPEGIKNAVEYMQSNNVDFCYSSANIINIKNNPSITIEWEPDIFNTFRLMPVCHQSVICKKSLLEKFPFDSSLKIIADYKWFMTMILNKVPHGDYHCNFVTYRLSGKSSTELENSINESKKVYKELFDPFYKMSDEELDFSLKTMVYPIELEDKLSEFFDDKALYYEAQEEMRALRAEEIPENPLTEKIASKANDNNKSIIINLLEVYKTLLSGIYKKLYKNLDEEDKDLFANFLLKRFAGIDTITEEERTYLDKVFLETKKLYQLRSDQNEPMPVSLNNKLAGFLSPTPVLNEEVNPEQELLYYYEYAHSFILKEYIMPNFEPENGQTILDCGAANGDTAILFKMYYPNSPVWSIECDDTSFEYLTHNIKINQYKDVKPIKAFLSNTKSKETTTIDELVKKHKIKNIGLIKFDIEGAERQALEGAMNTIITQKPNLIIPIYHLFDDCFYIPKILSRLNMPMEFKLRWVEKRIWGMDCTLFVKFK